MSEIEPTSRRDVTPLTLLCRDAVVGGRRSAVGQCEIGLCTTPNRAASCGCVKRPCSSDPFLRTDLERIRIRKRRGRRLQRQSCIARGRCRHQIVLRIATDRARAESPGPCQRERVSPYAAYIGLSSLRVPGVGLEPTRSLRDLGGLSPLRLPIPPPGPASTVPGRPARGPDGTQRLCRHKLTRVVDCEPQHRTSTIGLHPRHPVRHYHTLDHVGHHGRPRTPLERNRNARHAATPPDRSMHTRTTGR